MELMLYVHAGSSRLDVLLVLDNEFISIVCTTESDSRLGARQNQRWSTSP